MWKRAESPGRAFAAQSLKWTLSGKNHSRPETEPAGPAYAPRPVPSPACARLRAPPHAPRASRPAPGSPRPPCAPRAPLALTEQQQPVSPPQVALLLAEPAVDAPADPPGLALLRALLVRAPHPFFLRGGPRRACPRRGPGRGRDRGQVRVRGLVWAGPRPLQGRLRVPEKQRPEAVAQPHVGAGRGVHAGAPAEGREGAARGPGAALQPAGWGARMRRAPGPSLPPRAIPRFPPVQGAATASAVDHLTTRTSGRTGSPEPGPAPLP